ncbi:alpha/beta hydrolase family protein [Lentzea tibetensis]|uniref:alpha/beta hydrolase family protein n=1 Tax=Lentzea tibetensis TaxID=2591470 RepID=UPI001F440BD2|nr:dienelactone hydrolase family protein [Lentzea tibetensis]
MVHKKALVLALALALAPLPANAAANPYERGPAPTTAVLEAARGPFATTSAAIARTSSFGGGTVYYPTDTSQGTFGAVAISPGFSATQSSVAWYGPRLASHGFVVVTINTLSGWDDPDSRARQLLAALDYLTNTHAVRTRIDKTRLGVMGHSMGGGGALRASVSRPSLQAAIPLAPWHNTKNWSSDGVPTLIVGAENDTVAPVNQHAEPFYTSITGAPDKAYLELNNAGHSAPSSEGPNVTVGKFSVAWLKRFIDNDTRYEQFLCPAPRPDTRINEYRDTCPHS